MKSTACVQMTNAGVQASLLPDLPKKARVSQAGALIGFQVTGAGEKKISKEVERLKKKDSKITSLS